MWVPLDPQSYQGQGSLVLLFLLVLVLLSGSILVVFEPLMCQLLSVTFVRFPSALSFFSVELDYVHLSLRFRRIPFVLHSCILQINLLS